MKYKKGTMMATWKEPSWMDVAPQGRKSVMGKDDEKLKYEKPRLVEVRCI